MVAHELGHHVQKLLGIETRMQRLAQQDPSERNHLSVDLELQADCFAGVWGHSTEQRNIVHPEDVDQALKAAAAVGDDHLQKMAGRAVSPERWTHGSSAQRYGMVSPRAGGRNRRELHYVQWCARRRRVGIRIAIPAGWSLGDHL